MSADICPTVKVKSSNKFGFVTINESDFDPARHELHTEAPLPPPPVVLPPPPGASSPLDNLPRNWRDWESGRLRELAAAVTNRTAENKKQAVEMIESALKGSQMTVASQGSPQTITLPAGQTLTVVADAVSSGNVWPFTERLGDTPGVSTVAAGATVTLGPFATAKRYQVEAVSGSLTYSAAVVDFNSPTEDTDAIAAAIVTAGAAIKSALVDGDFAGDVAVTGIAAADRIVSVTQYVGAGIAVTDVVDLTAEFTAGAAVINNDAGTDTTGDKLLVLWVSV